VEMEAAGRRGKMGSWASASRRGAVGKVKAFGWNWCAALLRAL
jgi:hypothetical protein